MSNDDVNQLFATAHADGILLALMAFLLYLPLTPVVFRTSRVVWIYLDRSVCSGPTSAGSFEKVRLDQIAETKAPSPTEPPRE